ncbi:Rsf1p DI49_4118 [Saccharomyces eubayanus]|uniref:Rsf1p n=1 Tax=Saccharomyces eubayanus TaxID=1080349 RepID=UPI0006C21652|nr:hypothetical protein DI49_4118 [Saccharomyces eubayanus]KOG97374.1 hypothetical protein DI49_4118 [Saccharomyces eubayanus]
MNDFNPEMGKFTTTEDLPQDNRSMEDIETLPNLPCSRSGTPNKGKDLAPNKMETPRILNMSMVPDYLQKENLSPELSSATVSAGSSPVNVAHKEYLPIGIAGSSNIKGSKYEIQLQQQQMVDFAENDIRSPSSSIASFKLDIMKTLELPIPKRRDIKGNHLSKLLFAKSPLTINTYCQFYDPNTKSICNQEMIWKDKNSREKHGSRKYQRHLSKIHNAELTTENFTQLFDHNSPLFQKYYNYQSMLMNDLLAEPETKPKEKKRKQTEDSTRNDSDTGQNPNYYQEQQHNILELQSKIAMNDLIELLIDLNIPFSVLDYPPVRDWLNKYSIITTDSLPDEEFFKTDSSVHEFEQNSDGTTNGGNYNNNSNPNNHDHNQYTH